MQQNSNNLYKAIGDKMSSTSLSLRVYYIQRQADDTEYSDYNKAYQGGEIKISDKE